MQETWVQFLGQEDPMEKEMATHSSILAWKIPWIEEPGRLQSTGSQELDTTWRLNHNHFLQFFCLFFPFCFFVPCFVPERQVTLILAEGPNKSIH